jgi:hypothetical protein
VEGIDLSGNRCQLADMLGCLGRRALH